MDKNMYEGFEQMCPVAYSNIGTVRAYDAAGNAREVEYLDYQVIEELKLQQLEVWAIVDSTDPCAMTCYLVVSTDEAVEKEEPSIQSTTDSTGNYIYAFAKVLNHTFNIKELGDVVIHEDPLGGLHRIG